jgi:hypothetical protein
MSALLSVLLTALLVGLIAFVAAQLLTARQSLLGYVGAGTLGMGIGLWAFSRFSFDDPLTLRMTDPAVTLPVLATLLGSLIVLFVSSRVGRKRA